MPSYSTCKMFALEISKYNFCSSCHLISVGFSFQGACSQECCECLLTFLFVFMWWCASALENKEKSSTHRKIQPVHGKEVLGICTILKGRSEKEEKFKGGASNGRSLEKGKHTHYFRSVRSTTRTKQGLTDGWSSGVLPHPLVSLCMWSVSCEPHA